MSVESTLVTNLNDSPLRKCSTASHHPDTLGTIVKNCKRANSKSFKSTANVGPTGAHGKSPRCISCCGAVLHAQTSI